MSLNSFFSSTFRLLSFPLSDERGEQKRTQIPKHVSSGPRARTCFARDYTESPTCRGSVFTRPRNSGLDACNACAIRQKPCGHDEAELGEEKGREER